MTIKESLNILDTKAIDNNEKFLDLRNLYEAANLNYEKKKKLKELIDRNEDPEVIAAYIINDDDKLKEALSDEAKANNEMIQRILNKKPSQLTAKEKKFLADNDLVRYDGTGGYHPNIRKNGDSWSSGIGKGDSFIINRNNNLTATNIDDVDQLNLLKKRDERSRARYEADKDPDILEPQNIPRLQGKSKLQVFNKNYEKDIKGSKRYAKNARDFMDSYIETGSRLKADLARHNADVSRVLKDQAKKSLEHRPKFESLNQENISIEDIAKKVESKITSYGGAFDIEDDMFFTKDDLMEFAYELEDKFREWSKDPNAEISDVYMTTPTHLVMEIMSDGAGHEAQVDIDMRRIRSPRNIDKYGDQILAQWKDSFIQYNGDPNEVLDESYDESTINEDTVKQNNVWKIIDKNGTLYGKLIKLTSVDVEPLLEIGSEIPLKYLIYDALPKDAKKDSAIRNRLIKKFLERRHLNVGDYFTLPQIRPSYHGAGVNYGTSIRKVNRLTEDTIKTKSGKWVNKGKEGTHGKFKTKKEADAQRKAMFANGYREELKEAKEFCVEPHKIDTDLYDIVFVKGHSHAGERAHTKRFESEKDAMDFIKRNWKYNNWFLGESLDEDDLIEYYGDEISKKYNSGSQKKIDKWLDRRKVDSIGDLDLNGLRELAKYVGVKTKELDEAKIVEPKYRDGDVVFIGDASGYQGTFLIEGDFRNIPEELYSNIRQIKKYGNTNDHFYLVEYNINSKHLFEEDYKKFFDYVIPLLKTVGISIIDMN